MPKITLSMIVKNEEKYLRGCLESVKGFVDEIVLVDTGSTDSTKLIAQEFNSKIYDFNWIKDFSAARNFALSKSTGDWILYLDADERLSEKSKNVIKNIIKGNKKIASICTVVNLNKEKNSPNLMKYVRFFKNHPQIKFTGKAHEQIESSLKENGYSFINSKIEITHLGYAVAKDELKEKAERNLELIIEDYEKEPTAYLAYQLASTYGVLDDKELTLKYAKEALEGKDLSRGLRSICYVHIIDIEMKIGNSPEAKKYVDAALKENTNFPLLNILASQIYYQLNRISEAVSFCNKSYNENIKIKNGKITGDALDLVIDDHKIIFQGIFLALESEDVVSLNFYLEKLKSNSPKQHQLINKILQNSEIDRSDLEFFNSLLKDIGLEVILKLLKHCSAIDFKLEFFSQNYDRYNSNLDFLTSFGEFLISINQLEEAALILNSTNDISNHNYSALFYLASVYVQLGNIEKLNQVLKLAENRIPFNSPFYSKLNLLKEKIAPLLV